MRFLAQQWCADLVAIATACGITERHTYRLIHHWRDDHRVINTETFQPNGGQSFTVLSLRTAKIEQYLGWKPWRKTNGTSGNITHKIQVSRVRAALCGLDDRIWIPERQLWHNAAKTSQARVVFQPPIAWRPTANGMKPVRPRPSHAPVHDGRCFVGGTRWSVEVELTLKKNFERLTKSVLAAYNTRPEGDRLLYICGTTRVYNAIQRAFEILISENKVQRNQIALRSLDEILTQRRVGNRPETTQAAHADWGLGR